MKLLKKDREEGFAQVEVENQDDLWFLKEIVQEGDSVRMKTQRTKLDGREKKTCTLTLKVEKLEYQEDRLRVTGEISEGAEDIELGYHTFNIEPGKRFKLYKNFTDEEWENLLEAEQKEPYTVLFCLVQKGEADFYIVEESGIKDLSKMDQNIPGKLYDDQDSGASFFQEAKKYIERTAEKVDKIVLAGPGFSKDRLENMLNDQVSEKIMMQDTSVTGKTGLHEAIKRGALDKVVKDSRISDESAIMEEFLEELRKDGLASYGEPVEDLVEMGAVEELLVTPKKKREDKKLVEKVEQQGGQVQVVHTDHEAGERLENFGGIAALLRFKP
ncbi:mRNA surveillance protein pelota [Candidatus Nanohalobium constans]|uniref:mRNA surveillance protein pelota n=1 Tax=Candidatus Nanohalobium constans TaxID=2565781 RepID=A0A5Q0UGM2_9ARCH|nr:mRNA surveillance protein pelota [Candidatus Nanohalobium constans]QGA80792.1 mRNA surveillance protein pelota [Candidatus Nanohalobium constans]